ncbi:serine/threonine-protein kinase [Chondromyces crocatus]|uniref:Protein kinase domain-containing protein n=1 Tax=Chondromyces crocatus TaxID=52 RepID=A0A0K1EC45_CHOCO|nr:serine/threonine-protein kinase [Chondromyces crocatus]AKT38456.1 uncharacterized protein CMC5_026030 [Chondromyces crocatus]
MGSVWVARHLTLGSPVAIKFMAPEFAAQPAFVARFEREARIAANLQTPHVVHVGDYGIEGSTPYLVMELLQGEDLGERLQREQSLSVQNAARIFTHVAKALRRAHEAGLVHRDLKPSNIFLAFEEEYEIAKILDFGIAKEIRQQEITGLTLTGELLGSPYYMSPEQVRGDKNIDHRSDLWSLGVILYRSLTGELPFSGDKLGTVFAQILVDPPPHASAVPPRRAPPTLLSRSRSPRRHSEARNPSRIRTASGSMLQRRQQAFSKHRAATLTKHQQNEPQKSKRWQTPPTPTRPRRARAESLQAIPWQRGHFMICSRVESSSRQRHMRRAVRRRTDRVEVARCRSRSPPTVRLASPW